MSSLLVYFFGNLLFLFLFPPKTKPLKCDNIKRIILYKLKIPISKTYPKVVVRSGAVEHDRVNGESDVPVLACVGHGSLVLEPIV